MLQNSITPIQQFSYTYGKNATDSAMIIDAMDMLYTNDLEGFCLVSSDSDFTKLASRLRESGRTVIGMGESKTPTPFRKACDIFTELELLLDDIKDGKKNEVTKGQIQGCFMNYPWADLTYCILAITSLILFLIHWSCKKAQINSISLYRTFFQRYSFYIVNRDWLCLETHTVPAKRHCHKSSPSFLSLYLPDPSRTLPDAGCCMRIF
ncbi:NYN domain [Dorea longicatena]|nr:NYN domain [Dorea longicatena]